MDRPPPARAPYDHAAPGLSPLKTGPMSRITPDGYRTDAPNIFDKDAPHLDPVSVLLVPRPAASRPL